MFNSFWALIPPLLTIFLVFATRNVILSLLAGVASCALLVSNFAPWASIKLIVLRVINVLELNNLTSPEAFIHSEKLFLFMFLLSLGAIISLLIKSGEGFGYVERLCKLLSSKLQAQMASLALSATLFIDDYLNCLTTAAVMRGLTDKFRVPRLKLAFLTTAMAAPLCSLAPISSWSAAIIGMLTTAGLSLQAGKGIILIDGFTALLYSIPFIFFSWLLIFGAVFIVLTGISYGEIGLHEKLALDPAGNLFGNAQPPAANFVEDGCKQNLGHSNFYFFSPLVLLSTSIFAIMLLTGGFGQSNFNLLLSLRQAMPELSLFIGALIGFFYTATLFVWSGKIKLQEIYTSLAEGYFMMRDSLIVLTLAWTMASFMQQDLGSGKYLANLLMPFLSRMLLPCSVFLLSGAVSFAIGSAWATMLVVMPMVIPMLPIFLNLEVPVAYNLVPMLFPTIGSVISGAIFGSSMSPIADLLVITSKNTQSNHFAYVKAQIQYLLPIGGCTAVSFAAAGVLNSWLGYWPLLMVSASIGIFSMINVFTGLEWLKH